MSSTVTRSAELKEGMKASEATVGGEALTLSPTPAGSCGIASAAFRIASSSSGTPTPTSQASANQWSGVSNGSPGNRDSASTAHTLPLSRSRTGWKTMSIDSSRRTSRIRSSRLACSSLVIRSIVWRLSIARVEQSISTASPSSMITRVAVSTQSHSPLFRRSR